MRAEARNPRGKRGSRMGKKAVTPLLLLVGLLLAAAAVSADTHLNVSLYEVVYQNVTFAQNFSLIENQTYFTIEGFMNVSNPGTVNVFDIDIVLENTENLVTDFIWNSGRNGSQTVFPHVWDIIAEYGEINTTQQALTNASPSWNVSTPYNESLDLDEDGYTDYISVNSTHLLINASSQYGLIAVRLRNESGPVDISNAGATAVSIKMKEDVVSLFEPGESAVVFATINITGTTTTDDAIDTDVYVEINDTAREEAVIHISGLQPSQWSYFLYNLSGTISPPLDIETDYTHLFNRKVLAGENFTITDTVRNQVDVQANITNINITIMTVNATWNATLPNGSYMFWLVHLDTSGDWQNVTNNTNTTWYWTPLSGILEYNDSANISYVVQAPVMVPSSGTYRAIVQNLTYEITATASNLTLRDIRARSDIDFNVTKQIIQPSDNEFNRNVTWQSQARVGTAERINYTLQHVSLWITTSLNPNSMVPNMNASWSGQGTFNHTDEWTQTWTYNYTDGSNDTYPPPIVWLKPYWIISNINDQLVNQTYTRSGNDLYIKYIYVINGYWLEVEKNITNVDNDTYFIYTWVHNRGNGWTPINMTVTVYDFVPEEFTAYGWGAEGGSPDNYSNVTGEYSGVAYQWDIGLKANYSASLAPNGHPLDYDEWTVSYYVNGSGDYTVSELYIVGLDPRRVDGAFGAPLIAIVQSLSSASKEVIFASIVVFLIVLNAVNLVMTHRINKKLDEKGGGRYSDSVKKEIHDLKNRFK